MGIETETTVIPPPRARAGAQANTPVLLLVFRGSHAVPASNADAIPPGPYARSVAAPLELGRGVEAATGWAFPDDAALSRRHARLEPTPAGVRLVDTSTNGTRVNGNRIAAGVPGVLLVDGDVVALGNEVFVFRASTAPAGPAIDGMLGWSSAMARLRSTLGLYATTRQSVLLLGRSGAGKEGCARALHTLSGRRGELLALNSAAIPRELIESTLFGHAAGAFTGAKQAAPGAFRTAEGGTLFLDEVADLAPEAQAKLLRVLESHEVMPVGTTQHVRVDVRVIAATHKDLVSEVARGAFRADLYARLAELVVRLPTLEERREDVLLLLQSFANVQLPLAPAFAERLVLRPWPLQVREVRRLAQTLQLKLQGADPASALLEEHDVAELLADVDAIARGVEHGPPSDIAPTKDGGAIAGADGARRPPPTREELEELLKHHEGNVVELAGAVGRSRKQVYRWLTQHGLDPNAFRTRA